ncbi:hypothetical protein MHL31_09935 [Lutibacter sp. A80]|uniref:hypothetical protein n=1 Tax=Lutibacter sp. A80 TaxID=2918453 RepID=UPI001F052FA6|nr:hypothetical protein [Lutibacter sp. A80]UMB59398.1 hypothetical protein MHL31_09935 [Lutibacter sp. A80]
MIPLFKTTPSKLEPVPVVFPLKVYASVVPAVLVEISNSAPLTVYVQKPGSVSLVWYPLHSTAGGSSELMVTVVVQVTTFPDASVKVQVTSVVVPAANVAPAKVLELLILFTTVTLLAPEQSVILYGSNSLPFTV